ncbi:MAG TPA: GH3 auxin-responsive promoter family protein [Xanthobacteraceae bacterium]|nr:GH3 auxin-responsive promoter family protein [Xanthobacteraceae bacterium]
MTGWAAILQAAATEYDAFCNACANPRATQLALLRRILRNNAQSAFGRAHEFAGIDDIQSFRAAIPIRGYDELRPWIDRAADGAPGVLTTAPVICCEETGGSASGGKLIPYTEAVLASFRAAVLPWLADLARQRPAAVAGRAYVAISPAGRAPCATAGGIPIGLASEGAYLGADLAEAFADILVVSPEVGGLAELSAWRRATLLRLLAADDLTFMSVWSPTFLIGLVEALPALAAPLIRALQDGDRDPARLRVVECALARQPIDTRAIWPQLDTISTWAHGPSRAHADRLAQMFPAVHLQPKGLLATEAPVSIPWSGSPYPAPALTSCVIEFIDDAGDARLADELRAGEDYRVVITTPGGLYRYDLADRVRCRGFANGTARLEFIGRAGIVSDLVGEKLTEAFVAEALRILDEPAALVPRPEPRPHYELLIDTPRQTHLAAASARIEQRLRANPQYAYARAIGQLGAIAARAVPGLALRIVTAMQARGRRMGDVKPIALIFDQSLVDMPAGPVDATDEFGHASIEQSSNP